MTDPPPPDDEIVSALLDRAATPDEAAAVEASAPARARRDELEAVRALVGEPVVPPAGARDGAVAAALAVFDDQITGSRTSGPTAEPPSLAARRERRARPLLPVLGAVASVLLVLVVAAAGLRLARGGGDSLTASMGAAENSTAGGGASTPTAPKQAPEVGSEARNDLSAESPAPASGSGDAAGVTDLGVVADGLALRRAVAAALATPPPAQPMAPTSGNAEPDARTAADQAADPRACDAVRRAAEPSLGTLVLVGTARFGGAPVGVLAYRAAPGGPVRTYLSAPSTCRVVLVDPG